jgi:hypothetical protein
MKPKRPLSALDYELLRFCAADPTTVEAKMLERDKRDIGAIIQSARVDIRGRTPNSAVTGQWLALAILLRDGLVIFKSAPSRWELTTAGREVLAS